MINVIILIMLIKFHKKESKTVWKDILKKPKTWILILAAALDVALFVHYFFMLPPKWSVMELFLCQILKLAAFVALFHFFVKSAAYLIGRGQSKLWRNRVNYFTYAALTFWAIFLIVYITLAAKGKGSGDGACKLPSFIITSIFVLIVCALFLCAGITITKAIKEDLAQDSTGASTSQNLTNVQKARKSALKNMWIIIIFMTFSAVFDFIYSLCIHIFYDS